MNVASLELCRELYELSGWESDWCWDMLGTQPLVLHRHTCPPQVFPAYDLGYLMRKLPAHYDDYHLGVEATTDGKWAADYITNDYTPDRPVTLAKAVADTPEDAACKLTINLFKQGILRKEEG